VQITDILWSLLARAAALQSAARERLRSAELLRLGFVMALAMTLHNLPEGFAVCRALFVFQRPFKHDLLETPAMSSGPLKE